MKVRELISLLGEIEDKEKDIYISLKSKYGSDYDLFAENIKIEECKYDVELVDADY